MRISLGVRFSKLYVTANCQVHGPWQICDVAGLGETAPKWKSDGKVLVGKIRGDVVSPASAGCPHSKVTQLQNWWIEGARFHCVCVSCRHATLSCIPIHSESTSFNSSPSCQTAILRHGVSVAEPAEPLQHRLLVQEHLQLEDHACGRQNKWPCPCAINS